jgi:hypothetical protein
MRGLSVVAGKTAKTYKPIHHHFPLLALLDPVGDFPKSPSARDALQIGALGMLFVVEVPWYEI